MAQLGIIDRLRLAIRAFLLGQEGIAGLSARFGTDSDEFSPPEYGQYLATSNGVYACASLRARLLSSLPLKAYKVGASGDRKEVTSGNLVRLLQKVNPFWTFNRLLDMTELSLCQWGKCFWFVERGQSGRSTPREIWWARPDRVTIVPHATEYISGFLYTPPDGGEDIFFTRDETVWFHYPNPLDEYQGLAPLAAARLSADTASAAMKSNRNLFTNGIQAGGMLVPKSGTTMTEEQAEELELLMEKRFKGADKAHKWGVLRFEAEMKPLAISPKDAEFLGALRWTLEDICRAYGVPLDLVGGQRTYENVQAAERAIWTNTIWPEAQFIASELTEFLLPMFGTEADLVEFDNSDVEALHESETAAWERAQGQIEKGAITVNEWRTDQGLDPVAWGDSWWAPLTVAPVASSGLASEEETPEEPRTHTRAIAYGSEEHQRLWQIFVRRTERQENRFGDVVADLFRRQRDSAMARLRHGERTQEEAAMEPFSMAQWVKRFRTTIRPVLAEIVRQNGNDALADIGLSIAFDVGAPEVIRFLENRAQRFARQVNETTWNSLKAALAEGINAGEDIDQLAERVDLVMGDRIRSSKEAIARTEVIGASNGGTLEAWRQSGVVEMKTWLCVVGDTRVSGLGVKYAARRRYRGRVVTLSTVGGRIVTVTAQHPILTQRGWIAADCVHEGDYLICDPLSIKQSSPLSGEVPYVDNVPAEIAEMFDTAFEPATAHGTVRRVVHLDGEGRESKIDVVPINSELRLRLEPAFPERFRQSGLVLSDLFLSSLVTDGALGAGLIAHAPVSISGACGCNPMSDNLFGFLTRPEFASLRARADGLSLITQDAPDGWLRATPPTGESMDGCPVSVFSGNDRGLGIKVIAPDSTRDSKRSSNNLSALLCGFSGEAQPLGLRVVADRFTGSLQAQGDRSRRTAELTGNLFGRRPHPVLFHYDRCVSVERSFVDCHVYDYTTENGWMLANGLIVHNSALDDRTRPTHVEAHGQTVPLDADFTVGGASGPGPGQMSSAAETVNCRCSLTAVLKERTIRTISGNGHGHHVPALAGGGEHA